MAEEAGDEIVDLVLEQVRRLGRRIDPRAIDRDAHLPASLIEDAATVGLFALTIPQEHGGLGLSLGAACQVVAELAAVDRSLATTVGLHCGLGTRGLVDFGGEALRGRFLPAFASGRRIGAFSATEPGAGSDLTAIRTQARVDGKELVVDGEKAFVTNGAFAGAFTVLARTPGLGGARAWSLLLVPRETPGVEVGPEEHKLGIRGSSTTGVRFEGVRLPRDHLLGTPGAGMQHAHRLLEWGRTLMAAGCIGTARTALAKSVAQVTTRRQFNRPIGTFQVVRGQVAAMASELRAMERLIEHVGGLEAQRAPIAMASAAAKVACSEGAFRICDRAVQLHGALGFVEDAGVALLLRDCRVTRIFEGANDVLLVRIGTALASSVPGMERRLHDERGDGAEIFERELDAWHDADARLGAALSRARRRSGIALVREQLLLARLAEAHVWLLQASAVMASGGAPDPRDAHATMLLSERAHRALDAAEHADTDAARDRAVTEVLYGEPTESKTRTPGPLAGAKRLEEVAG